MSDLNRDYPIYSRQVLNRELEQQRQAIETVSPEGTFCDTVQVRSGAGDMQLI